jgi:hypothetical protein
MPGVLACGAGLEVSEEEVDGAAGTIAHDPLQTLGWTWFYPIVARGHGDQANGVKVDRLGPARRRQAEPTLIEDNSICSRYRFATLEAMLSVMIASPCPD